MLRQRDASKGFDSEKSRGRALRHVTGLERVPSKRILRRRTVLITASEALRINTPVGSMSRIVPVGYPACRPGYFFGYPACRPGYFFGYPACRPG